MIGGDVIVPRATYPEIPLFVDYTLEKEDPEHHYGPELTKVYHQFLSENPEKGKEEFFSLVERMALQIPKITYLDESKERENYRIHFDSALAVKEALPREIPLMFLMDIEGNYYAHEKVRGDATSHGFHHSSFTAASGVAFAGMIMLDNEGKVKWINDDSGHYRPFSPSLKFLLSHLESQGVPLDHVPLALRKTVRLYSAKEWLDAYRVNKKPIPGLNFF